MPQDPADLPVHDEFWRPKVVYGMATSCLLLGLAVGYLLRGSDSHTAAASSAVGLSHPQVGASPTMSMLSLEQMKAMADKKVDPLLAQLKTDPKNKDLLLQVAYFYKSSHQFKDAAAYFDQALQVDPKNIAARPRWPHVCTTTATSRARSLR
jgi:Tfp pilus assembly protein PilF